MNAIVAFTTQYGLSSDGNAKRTKMTPTTITPMSTASRRPSPSAARIPLIVEAAGTPPASADPATCERVLAPAREEQQRDDRQHEWRHVAEVRNRVDRGDQVVDKADDHRRDEGEDQ